MTAIEQEQRKLSPGAKFALDVGPLIALLAANKLVGFRWATAVFIVAFLVALGFSWRVERRVSPLALVTLAFVLVFGGLTVWLDNALFFQIKVTVIEALIGALLLAGLAFKKLFIKSLLGMAIAMDDDGWRKFTWRFASFSFALAIANEFARRGLSQDQWLWFKVGGITLATLGFILAQMPLFKRHELRAPRDAAQ